VLDYLGPETPTTMTVSARTLPAIQTSGPVRSRVYVQDLVGGGHRTEIYSSTTTTAPSTVEWPVGWRDGRLILGGSEGAFSQNGSNSPTGTFIGYHVVDPATGRRLATLCATGITTGPLADAGVVCEPEGRGQVPVVEDWIGAVRFATPGYVPYALSPDGRTGHTAEYGQRRLDRLPGVGKRPAHGHACARRDAAGLARRDAPTGRPVRGGHP